MSITGGSSSNNATLWLILWMANNIGVTLVNKACFQKIDFHYPYFLSAVHMACNMAGAEAIFATLKQRKHSRFGGGDNGGGSLEAHQSPSPPPQQPWVVSLLGGDIRRQQLDGTGQRLILAFSVIFSLNIAIGNVSLKHVSVNFNQVMRSLVPAITIVFAMLLKKPVSRRKLNSVVPIVIGVAMACFGDMSFSATGFIVTVFCIVLAALKVVASGEMLTGALKMHPVDLLGHMAPLALVQCMAVAFLNGEISQIARRWATDLSPAVDPYPMAAVWFSGILSFSLNICSLQANKVTSPLTLCIAANVKQVIMIAASTFLFRTRITPLNGAGIVVVLTGSAWYSYISIDEKNAGAGKSVIKDDGLDDDEVAAMEAVPLMSDKDPAKIMHRN